MSKRTFTLLGCGIGLALFFGLNILANAGLRSMRFDFTEEKLYTLTEGSKRIARGLDEPIRLYFYFSEDVATDVPAFKSYGNRVREMLEEYTVASDGSILLEVIEPERFSEEEDRAIQEGLLSVPVGSDSLFFGLVGTNATDDRETITFFDPQKERFLEYDVSRMIHTLAHPERPVVAVLSSLPLQGAPPNPMMGSQGSPGWQILEQLGALFDVRTLDTTAEELPADTDVLVLIHPRHLSESTLYAIDQYVLAGGKTIAYVDPHCEADQSANDPSNPMAAMGASRASDLGPLLGAWGVELATAQVVGDRTNALTVMTGSQTSPEQWPYVVWMALDDKAVDTEDAVTSLLEQLNLATPGALRPLPDATTTFEPLVQTSEDSMMIDVGMVQFMPDPKRLLNQFVAEHQRHTVAARITGDVDSAFPDGPPEDTGLNGDPEEAPAEEGAEPGEEVDGDHLARSQGPVQIIVVADADNLHDRFWIREERLFGQIPLGYRKTSDNGDLLINAVENFAGGDDLISIRARGRFARPFEVVEEIRRDAEQRFLAEEQELERRLNEIQTRINDLQREKAADDSALILSPEQVQELERAREEQTAARKALRDVQHELRKDIERLGTGVKLVNVFLIPLIVAGAAIALGSLRIRRRNRP